MANGDHHIRIAATSDLGALATLHARSFPDESWSITSLATLVAAPSSFCLIIGEEASGPLGFLLGQAVAGEAEVVTFAVDPTERGRGLGARLLAAALATAGTLGALDIYLEVAADNFAARGLYGRAGFVEVGRRQGYYRRPQGTMDAVIMKRGITASPAD